MNEETVPKLKNQYTKYPELNKFTKDNNDAFHELQRLTTAVAKEVDSFWRGAQEEMKELAKIPESERSDARYNFYESLLNIVVDQDGKKVIESIYGKKQTEKILAAVESVNGTFDRPTRNVPLQRVQDLGTLRGIQLVANARARSDNHMKAVIRSIKQYLFANGIKINIENEEISDKLTEKLKQINFEVLMEDAAVSSVLDGEVGLLLRSRIRNKQVEFSAQEVHSEEIESIEASKLNTTKKLSYQINFHHYNDEAPIIDNKALLVPDIEYLYAFNTRGNPVQLDYVKSKYHSKFSKNEVLLFIKFGRDRLLRGESQAEPYLRALRLHEDFIINRAILNYERSKVLYVRKNKAGRNPKLSGLNLTKSKAPKGGTELTLYGNEDYEIMSPTLHAQDAEKDALLLLYEISSGSGMPISVVGQRLDQANYNSLKNSDSPFSQMILDFANFYIRNMQKTIKFMLRRMVEAKELPESIKIRTFVKESDEKSFLADIYKLLKEKEDPDNIAKSLDVYKDNIKEVEIKTEDIPIEIVIADSIRPNPLDMAKVWFIYSKMKIVSRQTLANKAGFTWEQELYRQIREDSFFKDMLSTNLDSSAGGVSDKTDPGGNVDDGSGTELEK